MDLDWTSLALGRDDNSRKVNYHGGQLFVCSQGLGNPCTVYVGYVPAIRSLIIKPLHTTSSNMERRRGGLAVDINSIHVSSIKRGKIERKHNSFF